MQEPRRQPLTHRHRPGLFVAVSDLAVDPGGADELAQAFRDRLRLVDDRPDFEGLEVWQDDRRPGRFSMVSWWASRQAFVDYLRSDDHRASHDRVPTGPSAPRPVALSRFHLVAT